MNLPHEWNTILQDMQDIFEGNNSKFDSNHPIASPLAGPELQPCASGTTQALNLAYTSALEAAPPDVSDAVQLSLLIGQAKALDLTGDWAGALLCFENALSAAATLNQLSTQAEIWRQIGRIRRKQGLWLKARHAQKQAIKIFTTAQDLSGVAAARNSLAAVYMEEGALVKAHNEFEKALESLQNHDDHQVRGQILNNLGIVSNMRGQWDRAVTFYQRAVSCYDRIGDRMGLARAYQNLGMTYADQAIWPKAGKYFEKSLALSRELGDRYQIALVYLNKIEFYLYYEDLEVASLFCDKCFGIFTVSSDNRGLAEVAKNMGVILRKQGETDTAHAFFRHAIRVSHKYRLWLTLGESLYEQAVLYHDQNKTAQAIQSLTSALTHLKKVHAHGELRKTQQLLKRLQRRSR